MFKALGIPCGSHQSGGQAQDGEQGTGGGEGGVFADPRFLPHLHVCGGDVVGQRLGHHGLPLLAQGDVTPEGTRQVCVSDDAT